MAARKRTTPKPTGSVAVKSFPRKAPTTEAKFMVIPPGQRVPGKEFTDNVDRVGPGRFPLFVFDAGDGDVIDDTCPASLGQEVAGMWNEEFGRCPEPCELLLILADLYREAMKP